MRSRHSKTNLAPADAVAVLDAIGQQGDSHSTHRNMTAVALHGGLRVSAVRNLTRADVELPDSGWGVIEVERRGSNRRARS